VTRSSLATICLLVLCGILVAGLWPFHAPKNEVTWLSDSNGLFFGKYGSVVSAGVLQADPLQANGSCSLEIWLEPRQIESKGTVLGFFQPEARVVPFAVRQHQSGLVLEHPTKDRLPDATKADTAAYVDKVFRRQGPVLVTITSSRTGASVYADGALLRKFTDFRFSRQDLTGRLVVGNSPVATNNWSGRFRGLAIYDRELTAGEVSRNFSNWTRSEQLDVVRNEGPAALYRFNEGSGDVIHDQVKSATDLIITERFFVLHEQFLERPWDG
jgi:hypothetical protein